MKPLPEEEYDKINEQWRAFAEPPLQIFAGLAAFAGGGLSGWVFDDLYAALAGFVVTGAVGFAAVEWQMRKDVAFHRSRFLYHFEPRRR